MFLRIEAKELMEISICKSEYEYIRSFCDFYGNLLGVLINLNYYSEIYNDTGDKRRLSGKLGKKDYFMIREELRKSKI